MSQSRTVGIYVNDERGEHINMYILIDEDQVEKFEEAINRFLDGYKLVPYLTDREDDEHEDR